LFKLKKSKHAAQQTLYHNCQHTEIKRWSEWVHQVSIRSISIQIKSNQINSNLVEPNRT
jgi:hypothetical protein